ncbi:MAG: CRISPR-associated helicase Cas3' [Prevotella sp.]|jgi:CRISPR-associated endonuclease/helicase Cas3
MKYYAHINPDDGWKTQSVEEHCQGTAYLAEKMAGAFGAGPWGRLCGLWHDIGKYSEEFQSHIRVSSGMNPSLHDPGKVDHTTAGGLLAKEILNQLSLPIAYCIVGHHIGLMDFEGDGRSNLHFHLSSQEQHYLDDVRKFLPTQWEVPELPLPKFDKATGVKAWHLWIRMLFSCLVDADWLDTEKFMKPDNYAVRGRYKTLAQLKPLLDDYLSIIASKASKTKVNTIREDIQMRCREAGSWQQDIYSLTVPTGGGKTLSSLVWAFEHALKHGLRRIIIAIPYTSIVTQTADTLRKIFGVENVVEHHSYVDFDNLPDEIKRKMKLATENWDAPIIVTTNVQLFESLFANKTSRCRKLHNITKSVLILDEVQTLPAENLQPIIDVLGSLGKYMGTSILFTTATQPAFSGTIGSGTAQFEGLSSKEIIQDVDGLFKRMRRVKIDFNLAQCSFESLAKELTSHKQILCVVNTRREARQLYEALPEKGHAFHLSRMMCQQHISDELEIIKKELKSGEPIKVISTQLIEAGVDIDFPVVWREMAGLDSIAQSAGRCNREGRAIHGEVKVFQLEGSAPRSILAKAASAARDLLDAGENDFLSPEVAKDYFRLFYAKLNDTDKANITDLLYRPCPQFEKAAQNFKMIDDDSLTIYVPYLEEGESLTGQLVKGEYSAGLLRKLQRYCVNVPIGLRDDIERMGVFKVSDYVYVLSDCSYYNEKTGLVLDNKWLDENLII